MNLANEWQSLHVFLIDTEKQNQFLIKCIYPKIQKLLSEHKISQWFFMKYWEGGPHLRLRVKAISTENLVALQQQLSTEISDYCSNETFSKEDFYRDNKFDGNAVNTEELPWYEEGSIEQIAYEPELERYGGSHGMKVSEQLFHASSEFAVGILQESSMSITDKINLGFDLLLIGYVYLSPANTSLSALMTFFEQYAKFYARFIDDSSIVERKLNTYATENAELLEQKLTKVLSRNYTNKWFSNIALDTWLTELSVANSQWLQLIEEDKLITPYFNQLPKTKKMSEITISSLASSHLHMLNNRLSIVPPFEFQAALLVSLAAGGNKDD